MSAEATKQWVQIALVLVCIVLCAEGMRRGKEWLANQPSNSGFMIGFKAAFGIYDRELLCK